MTTPRFQGAAYLVALRPELADLYSPHELERSVRTLARRLARLPHGAIVKPKPAQVAEKPEQQQPVANATP